MLIWWWRYIYYNYYQYWKLFNDNHWYGIWIMDWGHRPQHFLNHCSKGNAHSSLLDCSHVGMHTVGWWPPTFKSLSLWRPLQPVMHGICHKTWSTLLNTVNPTVTLLSIMWNFVNLNIPSKNSFTYWEVLPILRSNPSPRLTN